MNKSKKSENAKEETMEWNLPGDPDWVATYLKALRAGKSLGFAAMAAGVTYDGALRWRRRKPENSNRYTKARQEARDRVVAWADDVMKTQAEKGSTWHLARRMALHDKTFWKKINQNLREAEPDTERHDVTGGESGPIEYVIVKRQEGDQEADQADE